MKRCFAAILAASTLCSGSAALAGVMAEKGRNDDPTPRGPIYDRSGSVTETAAANPPDKPKDKAKDKKMRCSLGFATGATFPTNKLKGDNKVDDKETGSGESTLDTALTFDASVQCPIIADGRGSLGLTLTRFTSSFDEIKVDDKENDRKFTAAVTGDKDLDVSATSLILDYTHSFDMFSRWTPYVGTGVGITWSFVEEQEFSNSNIDQPFHATVNENTNSSFSWRIKAGTEYAINDAWGLYGEVRYGQSSGFTSKDGITYVNGAEADVDYESFGGISTVAGVRIRF